MIGLLALTVRDLMEGDVRVGFGSAKGYGEINAAIGGLALAAWGAVPETFAQDLSEASLRGVSTSAAPGADGELGEYLQYALLELEEKIESVGR